MANNKKTDKISDELIAAFLEGNVNGDEAARVLDSLKMILHCAILLKLL